jgi:hypothetical protein
VVSHHVAPDRLAALVGLFKARRQRTDQHGAPAPEVPSNGAASPSICRRGAARLSERHPSLRPRLAVAGIFTRFSGRVSGRLPPAGIAPQLSRYVAVSAATAGLNAGSRAVRDAGRLSRRRALLAAWCSRYEPSAAARLCSRR